MKFRIICPAVIVVGLAAAASAQEKKPYRVAEDVVVFNAQTPGPGAVPGQRMVATTFFMGRDNVKGAPYAAEAVNESTQVLADGTRITHKSTSKMYRDSEGRTRMESNFAPVGNWVPEGPAGGIVSITDPVSGEMITLNSQNKSAFRNKLPAIRHSAGVSHGTAHATSDVHVEVRTESSVSGVASAVAAPPGAGAGTGNVIYFSHGGAEGLPMRLPLNPGDMKAEPLGKQTIEGVECEGVRQTMTIAAGAMGNDRPIVVTTERWTSPELGIEILRKHNDPRTGEQVYRVTMLQRGEQPRSLFEVPADYKVEEAPRQIRIERKIESKDNI